MNVRETSMYGMTVKMYREPIVAEDTFVSPFVDLEFDHYAYRYFDSELLMYRILDINFERYMEERGDIYRMGSVLIPTVLDQNKGVL